MMGEILNYWGGMLDLGVSPITPGYQTYCIDPHLGGLEWIEGTVPTELGDVNLYMDTRNIKIQTAGGKGFFRIFSSVVPTCLVDMTP